MTPDEWKHRAEREAAAILSECAPHLVAVRYPTLVDLMAIAWMQGTIYGIHETLSVAEQAFDSMRVEL